MKYDTICSRVNETGMLCRGGFHPRPDDGLPAGTGTAVMVGNAGPRFWQHFQAELPKNSPEPLNHWSGSVLKTLADELGIGVLFPFGGPPHHPFQRWAQRAEAVYPSPMGPLIHPVFGLWHAYRGLLIFPEKFALPVREKDRNPCDDCADRPCLNTCPAGAITVGGFEIDPCITHLTGPTSDDCMDSGCAARRACPVGTQFAYKPNQARFHHTAFFRAYSR